MAVHGGTIEVLWRRRHSQTPHPVPQWPVLGQLVFSSRFPSPEPLRPLKDAPLESLHLHPPLESTWARMNGALTPLQRELLTLLGSYRDLLFPERSALGCGEEVRRVYCLHALNHVLKANARVLANNALRRAHRNPAQDDAFRDQGLTRPKVRVPWLGEMLMYPHSHTHPHWGPGNLWVCGSRADSLCLGGQLRGHRIPGE